MGKAMTTECALGAEFFKLAKSLEAEARKSAQKATSKGGLGGMMDAAEAGALFKVAQHFWNAAQGMEARKGRDEGAVNDSPVRKDAPSTGSDNA